MQMLALAEHYLPEQDINNPETLGKALWLEQRAIDNLAVAVNQGIAKSFE